MLEPGKSYRTRGGYLAFVVAHVTKLPPEYKYHDDYPKGVYVGYYIDPKDGFVKGQVWEGTTGHFFDGDSGSSINNPIPVDVLEKTIRLSDILKVVKDTKTIEALRELPDARQESLL